MKPTKPKPKASAEKPASKYFDGIRIKSGSGKAAAPKVDPCQWKDCDKAGAHKAPMGRGHEGKFYLFCVDHVRQYNASYNYFTGMSDDQVQDYQKDAMTGHRPTWKSGANAWAHGTKTGARTAEPSGLKDIKSNDPHAFFNWRSKRTDEDPDKPNRYLKPMDRKALEKMHLPQTATKKDIKDKFKELVKLHHPDANGGDRRSEDTLREIIQAYNHLKASGMV